jgi:hypothetical protein
MSPLDIPELNFDIEPSKIFEVNSRVVFDKEFAMRVKKEPWLLCTVTNIPIDTLRNLKVELPPMASDEFKEILLRVAEDIKRRGIIAEEEFEYLMAKAENYVGLMAVLVLVVAVALWIWLWVFE